MIDDSSARLARLEEKITMLDRDIAEIKSEQADSRKRSEHAALDANTIRGQLGQLITALQDHQKWHEDNSGKKYKITDIILAIGMLAITFLEFMKNG